MNVPKLLAMGLSFSCASTFAAEAAEDKVRAALTALSPGSKIESIRPAPMPGVYEAVIEGTDVYVSADGKFLYTGALWDVKAARNLTEDNRSVRRSKELATFGSEQRIVFAAEKPQHKITVFTDLDCGYCRKLHESMSAYNDAGISVEYILFPRGGLDSPSFNAAVSVWCADDRRQSLTLAKRGERIEDRVCPSPIRAGFELGRRIGITSTPTIITEKGTQLLGFVPPEQLLVQLK